MSAYCTFARPPLAILVMAAACVAAAPAAFSASSTESIAVKDGEAWIAYEWVQDADGDGVNKEGLYLVRPDGRDRHLLLARAVGHPDWSPDGKRLAVDTEPEDGEQIWMLDPDGSSVTV